MQLEHLFFSSFAFRPFSARLYATLVYAVPLYMCVFQCAAKWVHHMQMQC